MKTKLGIVIAVRNCLQYTQEAIASIKTKWPYQVYVIDDHSDQDMKDWLETRSDIIAFYDPPESTGLAYNWNLGIRTALDDGCTHIFVPNNDVLFNPKTIDNLVTRINKGDVVMVTGINSAGACPSPLDIFNLEIGEDSETEHPDFSCFMITKKLLNKVGYFDENFRGAYCEDSDMHARIVLSGNKAITYNRAPYYHYASMTLKQNPNLSDQIRGQHGQNMNYFVQKWGHSLVGDPPEMQKVYFKTPFNDPNKSIKDW